VTVSCCVVVYWTVHSCERKRRSGVASHTSVVYPPTGLWSRFAVWIRAAAVRPSATGTVATCYWLSRGVYRTAQRAGAAGWQRKSQLSRTVGRSGLGVSQSAVSRLSACGSSQQLVVTLVTRPCARELSSSALHAQLLTILSELRLGRRLTGVDPERDGRRD